MRGTSVTLSHILLHKSLTIFSSVNGFTISVGEILKSHEFTQEYHTIHNFLDFLHLSFNN